MSITTQGFQVCNVVMLPEKRGYNSNMTTICQNNTFFDSIEAEM